MHHALRSIRFLISITLVSTACSPQKQSADSTLPLRVEVRADTSNARVLDVNAPPEANVWVARVAPVRSSPLEVEIPDAPQDTTIPTSPSPPMLEIDDDLKPPILRSPSVLMVPPEYTRRRRVESVELDVRIDESGEVTDALWAGGSNDSTLVQSATECALKMRFFAALQSGKPVPVWCRQRFDFGGGKAEVAR